ncbi:MAG: hypothetical protein ACOCWO_05420, partial [Candidatus Muiribacteriaceae bacterium]
PDHAKVKKTLVKLADDGLYLAKEGGRNQVRVAANEKGISQADDVGEDETEKQTEAPEISDSTPEPENSAGDVKPEGEEDIFKF